MARKNRSPEENEDKGVRTESWTETDPDRREICIHRSSMRERFPCMMSAVP